MRIYEYEFAWIIGFGYIPQTKNSFTLVVPFFILSIEYGL